jgi:hypothetical protein
MGPMCRHPDPTPQHGARLLLCRLQPGVRLVSDTVRIEGKSRSIYEVLEDPKLAKVLSAEGVIYNVRGMSGTLSGDSQDRLAPLPIQ